MIIVDKFQKSFAKYKILNNFFTFSYLLERIVYLKCKKVSLSLVSLLVLLLFYSANKWCLLTMYHTLKILVWIYNKFIYQIITFFDCYIKISIIIMIVENVLIVFMINYSVFITIYIDWEEFPDYCLLFARVLLLLLFITRYMNDNGCLF